MISLRRRLTRSLLVTLSALMLAGGVVAYCATRAFLIAEFDSSLRVRAGSVVALVEFEQGRFQFESSDELAADFDSPAGYGAYEIRLASGDVLARSRSLQQGDLPARAVPEGGEEIFDLPLRGDHPGRAIAIAFRPEAAEVVEGGQIVHAQEPWTDPPLQLVLAQDRQDLDAALGSFGRGIALTEVVLLVLVAVLVRIGVRRGLTPLSALAAEVDAIDEASLDRRLAIEGQPTELVGVRRKLNELLERLQMAFDRERRFSSGAAHELRTPIAELRALTEVALKWPAGPDHERTKDLSEAHAIACRMEEVVGALLAIARDGHVEERSAREDLEVRPIVEAAVASAAAIAEVKRVEVAIDVPAGLLVRSKRVPLQTLLRNLVENAFEYAPPSSRVLVSARADGSFALISVTNEDATLAEADLSHVFEPFWRKDDSRTDARHSGLGLAVCETLARAIDASIRVALDPPGHVTFTLALAREPEITRSRASRAPARS